MPLHLITGHKGEAHISSADVGAFNAGVFGQGEYVLNTGQKFKIEVLSNNAVKLYDGDLIMQGRHISLKSGSSEELAIDNGTVDLNRIDLIVVRYTQDIETGVESAEFAVIKGEPAVAAVAPEYTTGDILSGGCVLHEMPLYKIPISGIAVEEPIALFHDIGNINTGTSVREQIPLTSSTDDTPDFWRNIGSCICRIDSTLLKKFPASVSINCILINTVCNNEIVQDVIAENGIKLHRRSYRSENVWYNESTNLWCTLYDENKIITGTYTGTGTYGAENKSVINCGFRPKFVHIAYGYFSITWVNGMEWSAANRENEGYTRSVSTSVNDTSFIWWNNDNAASQLNADSTVYSYFIVG